MASELTVEQLLEIARAATPGTWMEIETESSVDLCAVEDDEYVWRTTGWGDIGTEEGKPPVAIVLQVFDEQEGTHTPLNANARYITTFSPATVISLLERLKASEERHDERDMFDAESEAAFKDLDARIEELTSRATAAEAALKAAMPWAKIGFYLFDECSSSYGDRHSQPEERPITWEWQQSRPDDNAFSALTDDADAFLTRLAEDIETSPWLSDHPIVGPHIRALNQAKEADHAG